MARINLARLERTLRFTLRHSPQAFGLQPDARGFVAIADLVSALRPRFPALQLDHIPAAIVRPEGFERFEIIDGTIRALYGHSAAVPVLREPAAPPPLLYHATSPAAASDVLRGGLRPIGRTHVHLTTDPMYARSAAVTIDTPALLIVRAQPGHDAGVLFYPASSIVWLADHVPPAFIERAPDAPRDDVDRIRKVFDDLALDDERE